MSSVMQLPPFVTFVALFWFNSPFFMPFLLFVMMLLVILFVMVLFATKTPNEWSEFVLLPFPQYLLSLAIKSNYRSLFSCQFVFSRQQIYFLILSQQKSFS